MDYALDYYCHAFGGSYDHLLQCAALFPKKNNMVPDGMSRFGAGIRFHDLCGLTKYPVDTTLPGSRLVIRVYQAQDHFTRQLVIPEIRLSDWEAIEHNQVAENR